MLESNSIADFEDANTDQKRIKLEEQQLVQPQGKVSDLEASVILWGHNGGLINYIKRVSSYFRCREVHLTPTTLHPPGLSMLELSLMDVHTNR